nr:MAG TPA: hypothetical protein [Caudoviricetes sp.]
MMLYIAETEQITVSRIEILTVALKQEIMARLMLAFYLAFFPAL